MKPLLWVWNTSPSSRPSTLVINVASSNLGSNFLPSSCGSNLSSPCFFNVDIRIDSVILRPACRFRRSLFGASASDTDSPNAAALGSSEEVFEVVASGDEKSGLRASGGTDPRARSRLSIDSIRSAAKRWIAKSRAAAMSRFVRSCKLRKSATERRYLSWRREERLARVLRYPGGSFGRFDSSACVTYLQVNDLPILGLKLFF